MNRNVIAIDGPAGSGKTTLAVRLADRLGAIYLDTGLLYRAATVLALDLGLTTEQGDAIAERISRGAISVRPPSVDDGRPSDVLLDGIDITARLRIPEVDYNVSAYSAVPEVRRAMLPLQRSFAEEQRVVMVGRDIATVVFPNAAIRIYLDASLEERARRRWRDLVISHPELTVKDVERDLARRDEIDSTRDIAPLEIATGSTIIDSNGKSIEQVTDEIVALVEQTWGR
jgi:cytidylate kinase